MRFLNWTKVAIIYEDEGGIFIFSINQPELKQQPTYTVHQQGFQASNDPILSTYNCFWLGNLLSAVLF